jgi:hypothetical protein
MNVPVLEGFMNRQDKITNFVAGRWSLVAGRCSLRMHHFKLFGFY